MKIVTYICYDRKIVLKRCMTIDTLILGITDKNKIISRNSYGELALKCRGFPDEVIEKKITEEFDVYVGEKGRLDIFCTTEEGALIHLNNYAGMWQRQKVLERKNENSRIINLRVVKINSSFHLFYCIDSKEKLLVHHVMHEDGNSLNPRVADYVGKKFIYDVCRDESGNIHILYVVDDVLMYKTYLYTSKSYSPARRICSRTMSYVKLVLWNDVPYAVIKVIENGKGKICVCNIPTGKVRTAVALTGANAEVSAHTDGNRLCIHWLEASSAFEVSCDSELKFEKASSLGRSSGLYRLRAPLGRQKADTCLCNLYRDPFDINIREYDLPENPESKPRGYQVDEMARKYADVLKAKAFELQNKNFTESLARIEASLNRLIVAVERSFPNNSIQNSNNIEENETWTKSE